MKTKRQHIYHYITKGSFDNYLWQTQENKLKYITQIMISKDPVRSAKDIDEQTMTASDFKALATGNPYHFSGFLNQFISSSGNSKISFPIKGI